MDGDDDFLSGTDDRRLACSGDKHLTGGGGYQIGGGSASSGGVALPGEGQMDVLKDLAVMGDTFNEY